jgi:hypothetical protein
MLSPRKSDAHRHATSDATAMNAPKAARAHSDVERSRGKVAATTKPSSTPAPTESSGREQLVALVMA